MRSMRSMAWMSEMILFNPRLVLPLGALGLTTGKAEGGRSVGLAAAAELGAGSAASNATVEVHDGGCPLLWCFSHCAGEGSAFL